MLNRRVRNPREDLFDLAQKVERAPFRKARLCVARLEPEARAALEADYAAVPS